MTAQGRPLRARVAGTAAGNREIKAHLSQYLRLVQSGESVVVTHRGREIAVIEQPGAERGALRRLVMSGVVGWSGGKPHIPERPPITIAGGASSQTVRDLRDGE